MSLVEQFDDVYGIGAAAAFYPSLMEDPVYFEKVEKARQQLHVPEERLHVHVPEEGGYPVPEEEDIEMLRGDPTGLTEQFEEVYGRGSARRYLSIDTAPPLSDLLGGVELKDITATAESYYEDGEYQKAYDLLHQTLQAGAGASDVPSKVLAEVESRMAGALHMLNRDVEALTHANLALSRLQKEGYNSGTALWRRAQCHHALNNYEAAEVDLKEAVELREAEPSWREELVVVQGSKRRNYLDLLGVTEESVCKHPGVVKLAYRKQCKIWHPDRNRGNPEAVARAENTFWRMREAYETLSHKRKRVAYLQKIRAERDLQTPTS